MSDYPIIAFTALLILVYGAFSKLSAKSAISAPMVFVTVGLFASLFTGDLLKEGISAPWVKIAAEITLVLVLFIDASTLNTKALLRDRNLPMRLLFIGLPITMVLGVLAALPLFPAENTWLLALMALILSPTDAALGLAVVTRDLVPLRVRQTINVESGLNDGIALPPILVCIAVLSGEASGENSGFSYWSLFTLKQFVFGPLVGGLVGWAGGYLVETATKKNWMSHTFQRLASIAIAVLSFSLAEMIHGNGFIAAYFAGMFLGTRSEEIRARLHEFGEAESQILVLFIFLLVGIVLIPFSFPYWDASAFIYALLSLTIIRMLPVVLSLQGTDLSWSNMWFISWFGPRGIASVLYLLLVVVEVGVIGNERIIAVITLTVFLSIFLHGITAIPLSMLYYKKRNVI